MNDDSNQPPNDRDDQHVDPTAQTVGGDLPAPDDPTLMADHAGGAPSSDGAFGQSTPPPKSSAIPSKIGPFTIESIRGEGGMGRVYAGWQEVGTTRRRVAIKVIKKGMDSESVLKRFELERQVLAGLNHPNIASLIDAGATDDGCPWFAMEYVDGTPVDAYCDHQRLRIRDRAMLFRQVLAAVQHAHENLVIHRDIKPENVLVTAQGHVKLVDFGIARLMTPIGGHAGQTLPGHRPMTPEYASPEQIREDPLTTVSDIYSLGVVLFRILTGSRPYTTMGGSLRELEQAVMEEDPPRPSTAMTSMSTVSADEAAAICKARSMTPRILRKRLTGDLDVIVLKAMRKSPSQRYQSAAQFSEDIQRHLDGVPILAERESGWQTLARLVRRHRIVSTSIAAMIVVAIALSIAAWQHQISTLERSLRRSQVGELIEFFLADFHDRIAPLKGTLPVREHMVRSGLTYLEGLQDDYGDDPQLRLQVATGYRLIGDIVGGRRNPSLGRPGEAVAIYDKAIEALTPIASVTTGTIPQRQALATTYLVRGDALAAIGDLNAATEDADRALAIARLLDEEISGPEGHAFLASTLQERGDLLLAVNDPEAAMPMFSQSRAIRQARVDRNPGDPQALRRLSSADLRLGQVRRDLGDFDGAMEAWQSALKIRQGLLATATSDMEARVRRDVAIVHQVIGAALRDAGRLDEASGHLQRQREVLEELHRQDRQDIRALADLARAHRSLASLETSLGNNSVARGLLETAVSHARGVVAIDPVSVAAQVLLIKTLEQLGYAQAVDGLADLARANYAEALGIVTTLDLAADASLPAIKKRLEEGLKIFGMQPPGV